MKLVLFRTPEGDRVGIVRDGGILDFSRAHQAYHLIQANREVTPLDSLVGLIGYDAFGMRTFDRVLEFCDKHGLTDHFVIREPVQLRPPIPRPARIVAMSSNYPFPGEPIPTKPTFFFKLSSTVIGPDEPIVHRRGLDRVDPEVELGVVIGKQASFVPADRADDYIAGYTVCNDVTARALQVEDWNSGRLWTYTKNIDTFAPIGPYLVTANEIRDPHHLALSLRVNGATRQNDNTANLVFKIPRLIEELSTFFTLQPGDIISTGTPPGEDPIQPGDVVEAEVEGVGILRNPVVAGA